VAFVTAALLRLLEGTKHNILFTLLSILTDRH